jgi:tripartite-type tricarboxylate transporter receptor subunit TctC
MKLPRRRFLHLAAGAAALPVLASAARAQTYPTRPVRLVVTFPPGGSNDVHARLIGQWLSERFGQSFVIENRPGGGGNIGTEAVVRSAPDGYTLIFLSTTHATTASFTPNLTYDLLADIAPVAGLYRAYYVMLVSSSFPARSVREFIAYANANRGKVNMGSNGVGATGHLTGELFKMMTGIEMVHVPYRGEAQAFTDMIGGRVDVVFATASASSELIKSGQIRALAITSAQRSATLPEVPTVSEFVPGFEMNTFAGIGAPSKTPTEIIDALNREINAALAAPHIQRRYAEFGVTPFPCSPVMLRSLIADEIQNWAKVIKFAGIKPE